MKYLLVIISIVGVYADPHRRIIGGTEATPDQFPFIVSLNDPEQFCDGSIIAKSWVLTAAHCLTPTNSIITVLAGTNSESSGGTRFQVTKTIIHEDYDDVTLKNDVGLMQIVGEFEFSDTIQPIELGDPEENSTCVVSGWGMTETVDAPETLQYVDLTTINLQECEKLSAELVEYYGLYLGPGQVCTLGPVGKGTCFGDSGGPLICKGKLGGVVSYGVAPCALGFPDVFSSVSFYKNWIQTNIGMQSQIC